jgi:hypothetical protein
MAYPDQGNTSEDTSVQSVKVSETEYATQPSPVVAPLGSWRIDGWHQGKKIAFYAATHTARLEKPLAKIAQGWRVFGLGPGKGGDEFLGE